MSQGSGDGADCTVYRGMRSRLKSTVRQLMPAHRGLETDESRMKAEHNRMHLGAKLVRQERKKRPLQAIRERESTRRRN